MNFPPRRKTLDHIETWIFDLDNTLYPASCNLFAQMDTRMGDFVSRTLEIPLEDAHALRRHYYAKYGTTLRGLMLEHGMDPTDFLEHAHALDLTPICHTPSLDAALERLPGRKLIYTNGSVAHAGRVIDKLGIARHFEGVFDIVAADYLPKPDPRPYREMVRRHAVDPRAACMIEDLAHNLAPAAAIGMSTVWVRSESDERRPNEGRPEADYVDHVVDDLIGWLEQLTPKQPAR